MTDRPEPEAKGTDALQWLFDSKRDYSEQMKRYKRHRAGK